ncbi:type I-E CRISPR-associated protein Cas6/Cse3/CasE [Actinomadura kijaniata]|uniref:type I-E CRISPR-associated protein Cas6/Cse3/CasE n=1 Tax=Actinomadura kijaniata TaxID=46161 RepID=UPI0009FCB456|nr:type I-E CRISPR-associated protein Cas6/Cse3/CasE [Actinomadura kijaniata]
MYLSRLTPELSSPRVLRDLADLHKTHQRVMSAFPNIDGPGRLAHGVLWRWDADPGHPPILLVQSTTAPDWAKLPAGYLTEPPRLRTLAPLRELLTPGRRFAFRLTGNPTRNVDTKTRADGKRRSGRHLPLRDETARLGWLARKGAQYGFEVPIGQLGTPDVQISSLPRGRGDKQAGTVVTIEPVRFEGHLTITEPDLFWDGLQHGIGRARPYGCGLLTLIRSRQ